MKKTKENLSTKGKTGKQNIKFLLVLGFLMFNVSVNSYSQTKLSMHFHQSDIREVIRAIETQTDYVFLYKDGVLDFTKKVTLDMRDVPLADIFDAVCKQMNVAYECREHQIILSQSGRRAPTPSTQPEAARELTSISGVVSDEKGNPLPGVNVIIKGTTNGTITNEMGYFVLRIAPGKELIFRFVGMTDKTVKILHNQAVYDVTMIADMVSLADVVVTGYQTLSRERVAGSYAVVTASDTKGKLETSLSSRIEGLVPGINYTSSRNGYLIIRGITTYAGRMVPLVVIDGLPVEGGLETINPQEVTNITVLKDAAASSIYGARAANGVIVVTTRHGRPGASRISYEGTIKITPVPDLGYLKLINSSELVDLQIEGYNYYSEPYDNYNIRYHLNPVIELLRDHKRGNLSDAGLEEALLPYRTTDNREQILDEFARTGIVHQHNLSISGGMTFLPSGEPNGER